MTIRHMTMREWQELCARTLQADTTNDPAPDVLRDLGGPSPGGAASELRVTRQRVHQLMKQGKLDAIYIWDDPRKRDGLPSCIFVTEASLSRFKLAQAKDQQELPFVKFTRRLIRGASNRPPKR